jgi:phage-related protein
MKSTWQNLVTGIGDANADIDVLLDNFLVSVEAVGKNLLPAIGRILSGIFTTLKERGPDMIAEGVLLLGKLVVGLITGIPDMIKKIPEIIKSIVNAFKSRSSEFKGIGKNIVEGLWNGIVSLGTWIKDKVSNFFGGIVDGVKGLLGIKSPSRVFAGIGENMALGLGKGWDDEYGNIKSDIENGMDFETATVDFSRSGFGGIVDTVSSTRNDRPILITVQSVLDGRVIGETSYRYFNETARAFGGA